MITLRCDVAVVGAGPAGSTAAWTAARAGATVVLLDRRREIGLPVQCAEYVPRQLADHVPWSPECVVQTITAMRSHLPDGEAVQTLGPGYMIHRWRFDQHLAWAAHEAGAEVWPRTKAVEPTAKGLLARRDKQDVAIEARVIVGADGPRSTVGKWIGQINVKLLIGAQCTVAVKRQTEVTEVYFDPVYDGGYGWFFPKKAQANVGVGLRSKDARRAREALQHLLDRLEIGREAVLSYTGGLIPAGGPLQRTWQDNIILVGDAAGQTHPITGAGVAYACLCGEIAGRVAAQAARENDLSVLAAYEQEWRDFLGGALGHATAKRRFMEARWSADPQELSAVLRQSWVAFPGYRRRAPHS